MERLDLGNRQFTQADVLSILPRLSKKTLQNWKSRGIIDIEESGQGKGNRHLYTGHGIIMLSFMERAVDFGLPPAVARKMADRVALCAQELWNLRLDELRPDNKYKFVPPASSSNEEYRRGFIFKYDDYYRMEIGRKDRTGSTTQRFYSVVAVDLININVLNQINRHLAGLDPEFFNFHERIDLSAPDVISHANLVLEKIRTLPVDDWDDHA